MNACEICGTEIPDAALLCDKCIADRLRVYYAHRWEPKRPWWMPRFAWQAKLAAEEAAHFKSLEIDSR